MTDEQLLQKALNDGYKTLNINYMDWNHVDWFLKVRGRQPLRSVLATSDQTYGTVLWEGQEYEFLFREKTEQFEVELLTGLSKAEKQKAKDAINSIRRNR